MQKTAPVTEKITTNAPRREHKAAANGAPAANSNSAHHVAATAAATDEPTATTATATLAPPCGSTLIEFPGTGRAARPQWRKDLSERVREIQQRRAREAQEAEEAARRQPDYAEQAEADAPAPPLGLVPPREDAPPLNPLVAAALRRIERARQPAPPMPRASSGRAATAAAVARVAEENYQPAVEPSLVVSPVAPPRPAPPKPAAAPVADAQRTPYTVKTEMTADALHTSGESSRASGEAQRASGLVALPSQQAAKVEPASAPSLTETHAGAVAHAASVASPAAPKTENVAQASAPATSATTLAAPTATAATTTANTSSTESATMTATAPRRVFSGGVDELSLELREAEITEAANTVPVVNAAEIYDDRAPKAGRVVASILDLLVVAFFSSPFAAIIELTSGRWHDPRVLASMGGIIVVVMFLYLAGSTALAGYTWGMSLFSLRAVDARTALAPTTGQAIRRAVFYMLSLVTFGIPILYALFDAEGRTAHDHLSGTIIVRE